MSLHTVRPAHPVDTNPLQRFRVTFGAEYPARPHPKVDWADSDGWVDVWAVDDFDARMMTLTVLGRGWSSLYAEADNMDTGLYGLGAIAVLRPELDGGVRDTDQCPGWVAVRVAPLPERLVIAAPAVSYTMLRCLLLNGTHRECRTQIRASYGGLDGRP